MYFLYELEEGSDYCSLQQLLEDLEIPLRTDRKSSPNDYIKGMELIRYT